MILTLYLLFCMLAVLWFDATRYIIPNWLVGSLLLLYPVAVYLAPQPVDWQMALACMLGVFAIGYIVFARGWMGGGDVKLITVCSLWVGLDKLIDFIFLFAVFGGLLSLALYIGRKLVPWLKLKKLPPKIFQEGAPVPYGIAIAFAFLMLLYQGEIPAVAGLQALAGQ